MNQKDNRKKWNIEISTEREIWRNELLDNLIPVPELCNDCKKVIFVLQNKLKSILKLKPIK